MNSKQVTGSIVDPRCGATLLLRVSPDVWVPRDVGRGPPGGRVVHQHAALHQPRQGGVGGQQGGQLLPAPRQTRLGVQRIRA